MRQLSEEALAWLLSFACLIYILRSIKQVLLPAGGFWRSPFVMFTAGALFAVAATIVALICCVIFLTERCQPAQSKSDGEDEGAALAGHARAPWGRGDGVRRPWLLRRGKGAKGEGATPQLVTTHPSAVRHGAYAGPVWLVPSTLWARGQMAAQWPPPTQGPAAIARRYRATLVGSETSAGPVLLLVPERFAGGSGGRSSAGSRQTLADAAVPEDYLPLSLEGVTVDLLRDVLGTRSPWNKRCPLQLSHPSRALLQGETTLYLFAESGSAKEQWYAALMAAVAPQGLLATTQHLYEDYCRYMASLQMVQSPPLPPIPPPPSELGLTSPQLQQQTQKQAEQKQQRQQQLDMAKSGAIMPAAATKLSQPQEVTTGKERGRQHKRQTQQPSQQRPGPAPTGPSEPTVQPLEQVSAARQRGGGRNPFGFILSRFGRGGGSRRLDSSAAGAAAVIAAAATQSGPLESAPTCMASQVDSEPPSDTTWQLDWQPGLPQGEAKQSSEQQQQQQQPQVQQQHQAGGSQAPDREQEAEQERQREGRQVYPQRSPAAGEPVEGNTNPAGCPQQLPLPHYHERAEEAEDAAAYSADASQATSDVFTASKPFDPASAAQAPPPVMDSPPAASAACPALCVASSDSAADTQAQAVPNGSGSGCCCSNGAALEFLESETVADRDTLGREWELVGGGQGLAAGDAAGALAQRGERPPAAPDTAAQDNEAMMPFATRAMAANSASVGARTVGEGVLASTGGGDSPLPTQGLVVNVDVSAGTATGVAAPSCPRPRSSRTEPMFNLSSNVKKRDSVEGAVEVVAEASSLATVSPAVAATAALAAGEATVCMEQLARPTATAALSEGGAPVGSPLDTSGLLAAWAVPQASATPTTAAASQQPTPSPPNRGSALDVLESPVASSPVQETRGSVSMTAGSSLSLQERSPVAAGSLASEPPSPLPSLSPLPAAATAGHRKSSSFLRAQQSRHGGSMPDLLEVARKVAADAKAAGKDSGPALTVPPCLAAAAGAAADQTRRSLDHCLSSGGGGTSVSKPRGAGALSVGGFAVEEGVSRNLSKQDLKRLQREEQERQKQEQNRARAAARAAEEVRKAEERSARERARAEAQLRRQEEEAKARQAKERARALKQQQLASAKSLQDLAAAAAAPTVPSLTPRFETMSTPSRTSVAGSTAAETAACACFASPLGNPPAGPTIAQTPLNMATEGNVGKPDAAEAGLGNDSPDPSTHVPGPAAPPCGALVEGLFGLNMVLVRIGFELLRRRGFSDWLHRLIQSKLERVRRPGFLDKLLLRALDLGFTAPQLRNIRAVAGPNNFGPDSPIWPQLALDVVWVGEATATISTKIDFDRAGSEEPVVKGSASAASATTASAPIPFTKTMSYSTAADTVDAMRIHADREATAAAAPSKASDSATRADGSAAALVSAVTGAAVSRAAPSAAAVDSASVEDSPTTARSYSEARPSACGVAVAAAITAREAPGTSASAAAPADNAGIDEVAGGSPYFSPHPSSAAVPHSINHRAVSCGDEAAKREDSLVDASTGGSVTMATRAAPGITAGISAAPDGARCPRKGGGSGTGGSWVNFVPFFSILRKAGQALAANIAGSLSGTPVEVHLQATRFEGTLLLWLAPPPSDRLWLSFAEPPKMLFTVTPVLGNRKLSGGLVVRRLSAWVRSKVTAGLSRAMVYPACVDVRMGKLLLSIDSPGDAVKHLMTPPAPPSRSPVPPQAAPPTATPSPLPLLPQQHVSQHPANAAPSDMARAPEQHVPAVPVLSAGGGGPQQRGPPGRPPRPPLPPMATTATSGVSSPLASSLVFGSWMGGTADADRGATGATLPPLPQIGGGTAATFAAGTSTATMSSLSSSSLLENALNHVIRGTSSIWGSSPGTLSPLDGVSDDSDREEEEGEGEQEDGEGEEEEEEAADGGEGRANRPFHIADGMQRPGTNYGDGDRAAKRLRFGSGARVDGGSTECEAWHVRGEGWARLRGSGSVGKGMDGMSQQHLQHRRPRGSLGSVSSSSIAAAQLQQEQLQVPQGQPGRRRNGGPFQWMRGAAGLVARGVGGLGNAGKRGLGAVGSALGQAMLGPVVHAGERAIVHQHLQAARAVPVQLEVAVAESQAPRVVRQHDLGTTGAGKHLTDM